MDNENTDTQEIARCLIDLSAMLMNGKLNSEDMLSTITTIDKLATMLARWYHIR